MALLNQSNLDFVGGFGERAGARTQDPVIKRKVAYQFLQAIQWVRFTISPATIAQTGRNTRVL